MFKKKSFQFLIAIVCILFVFIGGIVYGYVSYQFKFFPYEHLISPVNSLVYNKYFRKFSKTLLGEEEKRKGEWNRIKADEHSPNNLQGLGYLSGTEEAPELEGVVHHDTQQAFHGLNLYVSGHEPAAYLMDMEGNSLHHWSGSFDQIFPDMNRYRVSSTESHWRKVYLMEDGSLLAMFTGNGIFKLDKNSDVLWTNNLKVHHDMDVDSDGRIWVLSRKFQVIPEINQHKKIWEDYISVLDSEGNLIREISLARAILSSPYSPVFDYVGDQGDIFHTNTIEIITERQASATPIANSGDLLVSFNHMNVIGLIDPDKEVMTWAMAGMSKFQHDPTFLENGRLLFFDNLGNDGYSRVLEIDPLTKDVKWGYYGNKDNGFVTKCCGTNQRLSNGNTLITETEAGRAFEVTGNGEIVWDFFSPHRTGENDELIASLFQLKRYPEDYVSGWLSIKN